ncbi:hypothetical protein Acor_55700 [Acrocarpospora corrugata]|uniref:Uncharacterized protein n=1 Tax=Acrocarpospora corrugata TaxID=35763 RepID=A0A5M3W3Z6_9ACTN|nr:hypothetical protein Acor_55700 [Acrocarpospora corrugata]
MPAGGTTVTLFSDLMITRLLGTAVAGLVLVSGAAHASPVKGAPELTHNKLYKKGVLPKVRCDAVKNPPSPRPRNTSRSSSPA